MTAAKTGPSEVATSKKLRPRQQGRRQGERCQMSAVRPSEPIPKNKKPEVPELERLQGRRENREKARVTKLVLFVPPNILKGGDEMQKLREKGKRRRRRL